MGILDKLTGSKDKQALAAVLEAPPPCPHVALIARWDNIGDMGHEDRASSYTCEACHETFTPAEAEQLRGSAVEKLVAPDETST